MADLDKLVEELSKLTVIEAAELAKARFALEQAMRESPEITGVMSSAITVNGPFLFAAPRN